MPVVMFMTFRNDLCNVQLDKLVYETNFFRQLGSLLGCPHQINLTQCISPGQVQLHVPWFHLHG